MKNFPAFMKTGRHFHCEADRIASSKSTSHAILSTSSPGWKRRAGGAFSLVELLIVLTVMGVLAAFAAPSLLTLQTASMSSAGAEFSGFLNLCRSKAIAERTSVRVGIVTNGANDDDAYRQYGGWKWNKSSSSYERFSEWHFLPTDSVFENRVPSYVARSDYAEAEKSAIEGDYVLTDGFRNKSEETTIDGKTLAVRYLTFSPSGRSYIEGGEKRNLIFVIKKGNQAQKQEVNNWYQFTVDTLTGRARIYRP